MITGNGHPDHNKFNDATNHSDGATQNRIITSLTVVFAQVQLLQRRIERGQHIGDDELREAIERVDAATRRVVDAVHALGISTFGARLWENPENQHVPFRGPVKGEAEHMTLESTEHEGGRATPDQMTRKHVFVVNGSPQFLDIVRQLLQDENYNVTTTNFVPRSFETIETAQPALLVIDLVIGEQAGWDLLARLRSAVSTQDIPILLVSTRPQLLDEARERHEEFGGDSYLTKPFDLDDLLLKIEQLIGKA